jgi:hypothetical protein
LDVVGIERDVGIREEHAERVAACLRPYEGAGQRVRWQQALIGSVRVAPVKAGARPPRT